MSDIACKELWMSYCQTAAHDISLYWSNLSELLPSWACCHSLVSTSTEMKIVVNIQSRTLCSSSYKEVRSPPSQVCDRRERLQLRDWFLISFYTSHHCTPWLDRDRLHGEDQDWADLWFSSQSKIQTNTLRASLWAWDSVSKATRDK